MKPSMPSPATTTRARSLVVAALAVAAITLGACGSSTPPATSPSSPAPASAPASSVAAASASPAAPSSSPSASASTAPQDDEVKAVTTTFVKAALTLGYPDKTIADYLDRIEPLMTKDGFVELKKAIGDTAKADEQAGQLHDQHIRGIVQITSPAKVTSTTGTKASASVSYKQKRQQQSSGAWKTVETRAEATAKVSLVQDGGTWLVDSVSD